MAKPAKRDAYDTLRRQLLDILAVGGPRKIGILVAWAQSEGYGDRQIDQALLRLKREGSVRQFRRYGGPHLEVVR